MSKSSDWRVIREFGVRVAIMRVGIVRYRVRLENGSVILEKQYSCMGGGYCEPIAEMVFAKDRSATIRSFVFVEQTFPFEVVVAVPLAVERLQNGSPQARRRVKRAEE